MGSITTLKREIIKAQTHSKPLLVVEGQDDPAFYEKIVKEIAVNGEKAVKILPVKTFGEGAGCTPIVKLFTGIQEWLTDELERSVRGIIDRDGFYYVAEEHEIKQRNSIKGIFTLNYYSYENYLFTEKILKDIVNELTNYELIKIDKKVINFFLDNLHKNVFSDLYYVGLECLRNVDSPDDSIFAYGNSEFNIGDFNYRKYRIQQINKIELDQLASNMGITTSVEDLKKIVKGKHFLYSCSAQITFLINKLYKHCSKETQMICNYNDTCDKSECMWKNKGEFNTNNVYGMMKNHIDFDEVKYIIDELKQLNIKIKPQYLVG